MNSTESDNDADSPENAAEAESRYEDNPRARLRWFHRARPQRLYQSAVRAKRRWERQQGIKRRGGGRPDDPIVPGQPYWTPIGPSVNSFGQAAGGPPTGVPVSGRVTAIAVAPGGQRAYVGSANGGVWLTQDQGLTWAPLDQNVTTPPSLRVGGEVDSLAVGGVGVAFGNTIDDDIIYVGTGEQNDFIVPAVSSGEFEDTDIEYFGIGVLRYIWSGGQAVGTPEAAGPIGSPGSLAGQAFGRLIVSPEDVNIVWAATRIGFYARSSPNVWTHYETVPAPTYDIVSDIAMAGTGSDRRIYVAYAGSGIIGIFDPNQNPPAFVGQLTGIPRGAGSDPVYRIALAATARGVGDHVIYALEESGNVYLAQPAVGSTFDEISNPPGVVGFGQGWYALVVEIQPGTTNVVWLGGAWVNNFSQLALWQCTVDDNQGQLSFANPPPNLVGGGVHPDAHAIAFGDDGSVWVGCDGGVFVAPALTSPFVSRNVGLAITQQTYIGQDPDTDAVVYSGCQDNGLVRYWGTASWRHVDGGDGGGVAVNPLNPQAIFREISSFSGFSLSTDGTNFSGVAVPFPNGSWAYAAPVAVVVSPPTASVAQDHPLLAFAADKLWVSDDWALSWQPASAVIDPSQQATALIVPTALEVAVANVGGQSVVTAFAASPLELVGAQRVSGSSTWTPIAGVTSAGLPADRYITALAIENAVTGALYITLAGTAVQRVWYFDGSAWHDAGLSPGSGPELNVPAHAVICDGLDVYVGTDVGVFKGTRSGTTWQWSSFSAGLPECALTDLAIHARTRLLRAATHGRGVWEYPLDSTVTGPQPATEVYVRADSADTGRVPNGGRFPWIEGAPDPTRPQGSTTYHWESPDIKVVAASQLPNPPQNPSFLDFDELPDEVDAASGAEEADLGGANHFFVQVHDRGWQAAGSLTIALMIANASGGLPPLSGSDYATKLPNGDLSWAGPNWHQLNPSFQTPVGAVDVRNPLVVTWPNIKFASLGLPNTSEQHFCAATFLTTPGDTRAFSSNSVDILAMRDPHVAQRNLHVVALSTGGHMRQPRYIPHTIMLDFWNAQANEAAVNFEFIFEHFAADLSIVFSPLKRGAGMQTGSLKETSIDRLNDGLREHWQRWIGAVEGLRGKSYHGAELQARLARESADAAWMLRSRLAQLAELQLDRVWAGRCDGEPRLALNDVRLPPRGRAVAAVTIDQAVAVKGGPWTLHILQRNGAQIVGGSTYILRPDERKGRAFQT